MTHSAKMPVATQLRPDELMSFAPCHGYSYTAYSEHDYIIANRHAVPSAALLAVPFPGLAERKDNIRSAFEVYGKRQPGRKCAPYTR